MSGVVEQVCATDALLCVIIMLFIPFCSSFQTVTVHCSVPGRKAGRRKQQARADQQSYTPL